jgi:hypothetical protein
MTARQLLILLPVLLMSACLGGGQVVKQVVEQIADREAMTADGYTAGISTQQDPGGDQPLAFSLSPDYHRDPPACAVVRAADPASAGSVIAAETGQAIATHLGGRIERVIGPLKRDRLLSRHRLDLDHPADAATFAWKTRCRAVLEWQLTAASETYLLAYGSRRIGLKLTLRRINGDKMLWQAHHTTSRGGGGLPLSPVGLVLDTVRAGQFMGDRDILSSMIHDVVRRLFTTLPHSL